MKLQLVILTFLLSFSATAQQDPIYAQYINNPLVINPASAGNNNMFNATIQYRNQWAGLEANPSTVNFTSHLSVYQNKIGLGLLVSQDKLGDTKNSSFNTAYAYKIQLANSTVSFGLQAGLNRFSNDATLLTIRNAGDDAFNTLSQTSFNIGTGILFKSDRYIFGVSVPRLLPTAVAFGGQSIELYKQHYYLFASRVWFFSETVRFKPSALVRATQGASLSADVNASFTLKENFTTGIFTRNFKSYGLLVQASLKNIKLGYVFELPVSSASSLNFVSQEITLGFAAGLFTYHDKIAKTF